MLARQIGQETPFPSLEFATEDFSGYIGGCVPGYSCTYMNTISWAGETSPLPMEINPRVAFERMFGRAGDADSRLRRMRENRSILDSIAEEARRLQRRVGAQDRARLSDYLDDVREIERRIQRNRVAECGERDVRGRAGRCAGVVRGARGADVRPAGRGVPGGPDPRLHLHDGARGEHADVPGARHRRGASRRVASRQRGHKMQQHAKITAHFVGLFANFIEKLKAAPEGDGSVLDHSLIAFGTGMSDGQAHNAYPLPFTLVGGAGGRLKGNRFIVAPEWTSVANVWLSVADMFGTPLEKFGESTGRVQL